MYHHVTWNLISKQRYLQPIELKLYMATYNLSFDDNRWLGVCCHFKYYIAEHLRWWTIYI